MSFLSSVASATQYVAGGKKTSDIDYMKQRPQLLLDILPEESRPHAEHLCHVGSRFTCSPKPTGTDFDILIYTPRLAFFVPLSDDGWEECGDYGNPLDKGVWKKRDKSPFAAYRKGEFNIICMYSEKGYDLFVRTTLLAKSLNLMEKHQRIELFEVIRRWQREGIMF